MIATKSCGVSNYFRFRNLNLEETPRDFDDTVMEFNRTRFTREQLKQFKTISGAFYKCRSKGAAASVDLDKNNTFYKRCLATFSILMIHTFFTVTIMYDSRILTPTKTPRLFNAFPIISYPAVILGFCGFVFYKNNQMIKELDHKYTPLWRHLVEETTKLDSTS